MNKYLKNLSKIEFVITDACTGRCKHCSEGEHTSHGKCINPLTAAEAVRATSARYDIKTVLVFGGEPLLYPEAVCSIIGAARELNIPRRQVITNGFFSTDSERIMEVAKLLFECGVNDLLLSVDAFHQETIPQQTVENFARAAKECGINIRLSPAWLVSPESDNPYNRKTREILQSFLDMGITLGEGNVVFPEGNALRYLSEYFTEEIPENPYVEDPCDVKTLSFSANGDVLFGNIFPDLEHRH